MTAAAEGRLSGPRNLDRSPRTRDRTAMTDTCLRNNLFTIADIGTDPDKHIPGNPAGGTLDAQRAANTANTEPRLRRLDQGSRRAMEAGANIEPTRWAPSPAAAPSRTYNPDPDTGNYKRYPRVLTPARRRPGHHGSQAKFASGLLHRAAWPTGQETTDIPWHRPGSPNPASNAPVCGSKPTRSTR